MRKKCARKLDKGMSMRLFFKFLLNRKGFPRYERDHVFGKHFAKIEEYTKRLREEGCVVVNADLN